MIKMRSTNKEVKLIQSTFPAGERYIRIDSPLLENEYTITCNFRSTDDIIDLLLLHDAIRRLNNDAVLYLNMSYFPYARQDRACSSGESHSLYVIVNIIKSMSFCRIFIDDAHSDVLESLFPPGQVLVVPQHTLAIPTILNKSHNTSKIAFIVPDAGASKKIEKLKSSYSAFAVSPIIQCLKIREKGNVKIKVMRPEYGLAGYDQYWVIDDICDGGATFIEIGKLFAEDRKVGVKLNLFVTHGIFSKGMDELNKYYDYIGCFNDMRKENV